MKPLVITENALNALATIDFAPDVLTGGESQDVGTVAVRPGEYGLYFLTPTCSADSRLLVIRRWDGGLFDAVPRDERRQVFDRCARIALRSFDNAIALNSRWMPYHENNRVSIFALGIGHEERISAEVNAQGGQCVYVYEFGTGLYNLAESKPDYDVYGTALLEFPSVLRTAQFSGAYTVAGQIDLEGLDADSISRGLTFEEWYPRLSAKQREFVDHELSGPLRLRGGAGTGKTLAMVMKAIKMKRDFDKAGVNGRILFTTHSWSMAEHVDHLISQIEQSHGSGTVIDVFPLLSVAQRRDYGAIGRQPLGLDSEEGKRKGLLEISEIIDGFVASDWRAYRTGCSQQFIEQIEASQESRARRRFCWDLLVEFGCVLAAEGILTHARDKDRYIRVKRLRWMMPLENAADKEVVFALWRRFLDQLRQKHLIASDQIIADVLNELSTFYWEAARAAQGYDVVFVDEMHLFNAQERLIFHHLLSDGNKSPLVVMALDPKQSPREVFTQVTDERDTQTSGIYERARLANSEKIDLVEIYRFTPEIGRLVGTILNAVPALDLAEDWDVPAGTSTAASGPIPVAHVVENKEEVFKTSIALARAAVNDARSRSGRVAILCLDDERFSVYAPAAVGQHEKTVLVISSRDDTEKLRYAHRKVIFSTPEYVAGLQFDTVFLIDVNQNLVPEGKYRGHHLRRFLAELYLGASRAEHRLVILASRDAGALSSYLDPALENHFLKLEKAA
jgi:hypothetical protein